MSTPDGRTDYTPADRIRGFVRSLRPWHQYKQIVMFIGVIFSLSAFSIDAWILTLVGAGLFSLTSGAMYIFNDVADVEEDRNHPKKRHRPIASGQLPVRMAVPLAVVILVGSVALSWSLEPIFTGLLLFYVVQNVAYSLYLKSVVPVDVFVIAIGFVIRAVAGVVLIRAPVSPWLVLCTFVAALMLAIGKRQNEIVAVDHAQETRSSLGSYTPDLLRYMFTVTSATLLVAYSLYTFFAQRRAMMLTIPLAFYAVFMFAHFVKNTELERIERILIQPRLLLAFLIWGLVIAIVLYSPVGAVL
jgi:4-hydroxybenzoate polyprenyltransferase